MPTIPTQPFTPVTGVAIDVDPAAALAKGLAVATGDDAARREGVIPQDEADSVRKWYDCFEEARKFDDSARRQMAVDRRYARGDSSFLVDANILGTNIEILESHLFARNPDFEINPGKAMQPPSAEAIRDAVEAQLQADGTLAATGQMAMQEAIGLGLGAAQAAQVAQQAQAQMIAMKVNSEVFALRRRYGERERQIRAFCETCEIIGTRMWKDAKLKARGIPYVRGQLTVGAGVLKAGWQERTEPSSTTQQAINDLKASLDQLNRLELQQQEADESGVQTAPAANQDIPQDATAPFSDTWTNAGARREEILAQMRALEGQVDQVVERGFYIDGVDLENFQIPAGWRYADHLNAPWNAVIDYPTEDQALADHGAYLKSQHRDPAALLGRATKYAPRKPVAVLGVSASTLEAASLPVSEADGFVAQGNSAYSDTGQARNVRRIEIWDRLAKCVYTLIEGVPCWVKAPWNPPPTTRFYPFFFYSASEVDGQRYPQSKVTRSIKLIDEYNRIGSDEAKHRRRIVPKTAFDAGTVPESEARKLEQAEIGEMVGLNLTQPGMDLRMALVPIQYPAMDASVYSREPILAQIDRIWGTQEAQAGNADPNITATAAEIEQAGFQARTGRQRDALDDAFSELALFTVEIARQYVTEADAIDICGPDAFWPAYGGPDDLIYTVSVTVAAGSSGKPSTSRDRESWATLLPLLNQGIERIGALRGASPEETADRLEEVLKMTAQRSGERVVIDNLIPRGSGAMPQPMGGQPGAPTGAAAASSGTAGQMVEPGTDQPVHPADADPMAPQNQPTTYA